MIRGGSLNSNLKPNIVSILSVIFGGDDFCKQVKKNYKHVSFVNF